MEYQPSQEFRSGIDAVVAQRKLDCQAFKEQIELEIEKWIFNFNLLYDQFSALAKACYTINSAMPEWRFDSCDNKGEPARFSEMRREPNLMMGIPLNTLPTYYYLGYYRGYYFRLFMELPSRKRSPLEYFFFSFGDSPSNHPDSKFFSLLGSATDIGLDGTFTNVSYKETIAKSNNYAQLKLALENIKARNESFKNNRLYIYYGRDEVQLCNFTADITPFLEEYNLGLVMEKLFMATRKPADYYDLAKIAKEALRQPESIPTTPTRLIEL